MRKLSLCQPAKLQGGISITAGTGFVDINRSFDKTYDGTNVVILLSERTFSCQDLNDVRCHISKWKYENNKKAFQ